MVLGDDEAKILDMIPREMALFRFEEKTMFSESLEYLSDDFLVYFVVISRGSGFGHNEDVVDVSVGISTSNMEDEYVVHHVLEGSGGVVESEWHDFPLVTSQWGIERRFPFVSLFDTNVMISGTDIKLCEMGTTFPFVKKFGYKGQGVRILDGDVIEFSVIDNHSPFAVFLHYEEAGGG